MIIPKEQRLGYEYRNYHHYAAIILELGTVGKILVTASILDLSNFKFQEFIMMSPIEFYLPGTYPPGTYDPPKSFSKLNCSWRIISSWYIL